MYVFPSCTECFHIWINIEYRVNTEEREKNAWGCVSTKEGAEYLIGFYTYNDWFAYLNENLKCFLCLRATLYVSERESDVRLWCEWIDCNFSLIRHEKWVDERDLTEHEDIIVLLCSYLIHYLTNLCVSFNPPWLMNIECLTYGTGVRNLL